MLSESPGAELLVQDILDAVRKLDHEWTGPVEADGSDEVIIPRLVDGLKENLAIGECLAEWGKEWLMEFFIPFYAANKLSQNISYSASFNEWHDDALWTILNQVKTVAWERDGCRGPIQGIIDTSALLPERRRLLAKYPDADVSPTVQPTYIFPFSIAQLENTSFHSYVERFSGDTDFLKYVAVDATDLRNIVLMDDSEYVTFSKFGISIEHVYDQYVLRIFDEQWKLADQLWKMRDKPLTLLHAGPAGEDVNTRLSGELCNLHCAIAKVLNISGARGFIYKILEDEAAAEELGAMAQLANEREEYDTPTTRQFRLVAMTYLERKCRQLPVINVDMTFTSD